MLQRWALVAAALMALAVPALASPRNPDAVAVIIGNRDYGEKIPAVDYAHRDAEAMQRFVVEVLGYDPENVIDLRDATKSQLEATFGNERSHKGKLWRYLDPAEIGRAHV